MEIDRIRNLQWNAERVIVFPIVTLQCVSGISGAKIYVTLLTHDLACGKKVPTKSWYRISKDWQKKLYGIIVVLKNRSNVILLSQTLF